LPPISCTRNERHAAPTLELELARDWNLFQEVERGSAGAQARCWENHTAAVVIGRHGNVETDVIHEACCADGVPIVRRFSGGGAVVLGRGCLNYAVALPTGSHPEFSDVAASIQIVLGAIVESLDVAGLTIGGEADLVLKRRKISGNAQRRGRCALIQHGTLLYDFDAGLATRYLREPPRRPPYRGARRHAEFLGNLPLPLDEIRTRLTRAWLSLGAVDTSNLLG